jgi:C1A family cysteine protease
MDNAFSWITKNGGLCLETDYTYFSGDTKDQGTCQTTCSAYPGSKVVQYVDVAPSDDAQMMAALTKQPVAIAIEADQREFQLYKSGVFTGACGTTLDHGVLAVGYGTENGGDYYLVKNSWGETWGDSGFIKLARGKTYNGGDGQCGILLSASYPLV